MPLKEYLNLIFSLHFTVANPDFTPVNAPALVLVLNTIATMHIAQLLC
jgi:hypothetical protein